MGIINADELAKSYKLSLLKKIKAGDLHDDDLVQIATAKENPKYKETAAVELSELVDYIGGGLPEVTSEDNGKVLKVIEGAWDKGIDLNEQSAIVVDLGTSRYGSNITLPNGLTGLYFYNLIRNENKYIIFKVEKNNTIYYGELFTDSGSSSSIYVHFTSYSHTDRHHITVESYLIPSNNRDNYLRYISIENYMLPPLVSTADAGKVLTVNSSGQWVAADLPDGSNTEY